MSRLRLPLLAALLAAGSADAKITTKVTLDDLVKQMPVIFTAKVADVLPDKPGMILVPADKLRGDFPFDRVPVNLTGDAEAIKEKQPALVLERLDKDLTLVVFASRDEQDYAAVAYTNGTWIRMTGTVEKDGAKEVTRWQLAHCETYFRRTFKGTTEELVKAIRGGLKGEKLPEYDEKEKPGYGPPVKKAKDGAKEPVGFQTPLPVGVIQLPFLGVIAALAALFPAVFGGAALLMRRWVAALSIASFISILAALVLYFPGWVAWTGLKSVSSLWLTAAALAGLGALWAARRYRRATRDGKADEFQPRYLDRVGLAVVLLLLAGGLAYAVVAHESLSESPWLELVLLAVPAVACLYFVVAHWARTRSEPRPVAISAETVGLWAGSFACAVAGVALMVGPRGPTIATGSGTATTKLVEQPLWVFEAPKPGEIVSTPCVTPERVFVAVHHRPNPVQQFGAVYALDAKTGDVLWTFDRDPDDKRRVYPLFSSPGHADGRIYIGEGYHTDKNSKLYCLDAATGKKVWSFATTSHTESSPAVADGRVVCGAGDDGLYCLDAATGQKLWQRTMDGGLHVDSNPLIHEGRVYAGSGISQQSKNTRIFCLDLKTGDEVWGEKVEYAAWGSPTVSGKHVVFATGNGTFSEDRAPVAGLLLCRDAATGKPVWERALPNSLVGRPVADRYQVYAGCRDGNVYALDRQTGDVVWSKTLMSPVLASPTVDVNPQMRTGEVVYAIGESGVLQALSPADGSTYWAVSFRDLLGVAYVHAVSTPVVVREAADGKVTRRVYVGLGYGPSANATPTARLYCFLNTSD
jgi:outer membrane protein assembly factor BamB